jgi:hypothetical protein
VQLLFGELDGYGPSTTVPFKEPVFWGGFVHFGA